MRQTCIPGQISHEVAIDLRVTVSTLRSYFPKIHNRVESYFYL